MAHIMVWRGDLPEDSLTGFWHHGIRCPDGSVIHYTGMDGPKTLHNSQILRTSMAQFHVEPLRNIHDVLYPETRTCFPPDEIVRRAERRIGQRGYHLLFNNCESFARWCVVGEEESFQTQGAFVGAVGGIASLALGGGVFGAVLTAVVAHRAWDAARNRSTERGRRQRRDADSDDGG